jgi:uncharacterized membrane-anchored protein
MALLERRQSLGRRQRAARGEREVEPEAPIHGTARLGRRTKDLVKRLGPGDVAIIDHADLDRMAAEDLVASGVRAVVNVAPSTTGRYPNAGPLVLAEAGVRLLDAPGANLFDTVHEGQPVVVDGAELRANETVLASGELLTRARLEAELERLQERVDDALAAFAENTVAHVQREGELLWRKVELPRTRTRFRDRHVLIVVRGPGYRKDLRSLRAYIHDMRPLIVGVDGGADALMEEGLKPDVVLGDMDSASDAALRSGAELIVHAYPDGRAPGRERLERLGLDHVVVPAAGTSQDLAMMFAYEKGASLIVSVGAHFNLIEFLDKNRAGMSSTFLTRLRIGETLVDAKGVSRLYAPAVRGVHLAIFAALSALLLVIVVLSSPALADFFELLWLKLRVLLDL